jgi:two-component sensor histidine kinase
VGMNRAFKLLICLWFSTHLAQAQHPVYRQLTKQDGLPSNTVYASLQDQQGYIWFGTEKGLVKFDGHAYRVLTHPSMTGQSVSDLHLDKLGRVWCQNFIGQHFYALNDSLYYPQQIRTAGFYKPIVIDDQDQIYVSIDSSVYVFNSSISLIDSFVIHQQFASPFLFQKQFTYTTDSVLARYGKGRGGIVNRSVLRNPNNARLFNFAVSGKIFCFPRPSSNALLYQIFPEQKVIPLKQQFGSAIIQTVSITNDSLVWLNTTDGTFLLNQELASAQVSGPLFKGFSISGVLQDKNGAYWVTTIGKGVLYIPHLTALQYKVPNELFSRSCLLNNGEVLIGGSLGILYQFNKEQNKFIPIINTQIKQQVSALLYDSVKQTLLVVNGRLSIYQKNKLLGFVDAAIKELKKVDEGTYLFAASGLIGLVCLDNSSFEKEWKHKLRLVQKTPQFRFYRFNSMAEGLRSITVSYDPKKQHIYVGSSKGLLQITKTSERVLTYQNQNVIAINLEWVDDDLYVSTENMGVLKFSKGNLSALDLLQPLVGNMVTRLKYKHKLLYILSENGAFVFDPIGNKLTSIMTGLGQNGLDEYRDIEVDNEHIYLLGGDLVKVLPVKGVAQLVQPVRLSIAQLFCNYAPLNIAQAASLSALQNNIRIVFNLPWLNLNDKLSFSYKLNDDPWVVIESGRRELNLLSLSPNEYTIQIKAESASGFVSNIESVSFKILPPIWERWWFYFLMVVTFGGGFYLLYAYRIKQINRQNKLLSQNLALESNLQKSMLSSIKAQMNPHFIFNALNTIQSYIYLNDKQNASRFLAKFSSLTRKILEMSNADTISLEIELSSLQLYLELEKMRFEDSFNFKIEVSQDIQAAEIKLPSMILQPYVENAIKHGLLHKDDARTLMVKFDLHDSNLLVVIDDNGIGRKRSAEINANRSESHQSFSTQANQKRLEILMQSKDNKLVVEYIDKVDEFGQALGTTVLLTIPIDRGNLVN